MLAIKSLNNNLHDAKRQMIRAFVELIEQVPDDDSSSSVKQFIAYLNGLLRIKVVTPPTIEIMSVIKAQKPKLYHATRRSITSTSHLTMLFLLDMDPVVATDRLQQFAKSELSRHA